MQPLLLRNGHVVDGTGAPAFVGDVLVADSRIAAIGRLEPPADAQIAGCAGLTIAPGFIDAHSHSDLQVIEGKREKVVQGVTSEVVGNCGFSAYPAARDSRALREFANGIFCGDDTWGWSSSEAYLNAVAQTPAASVASLVGHGSLRIAVAGNRLGPLPESDVARMESLLDEALGAGAAGFSTGLMYAPGSSAPFDELARLCRVVARHGKIYTSHIRSYFSGLVAAIEEQIELARRTGCRLQISHLQAVGAPNWDQQPHALERIERARARGIDIAFDCYPYIAGSTVLTQLLPQWALEGGVPGMMIRLNSTEDRRSIAKEIESTNSWRWADIHISAVGSEQNQTAVGRNLFELAELRSCEPVDAMLDLLIEERGAVNMISFNQSEENLRQSLAHPLSIVISDGFYVRGKAHPRLYGTFPLLLGTFVRDRKWLTLEDAVHKITARPAERFGFEKRGKLAPGYHADITIFDSALIGSPATYDDPARAPVGIQCVLRNGHVIEGSVPV
ncbi:MAG: N-acyl-D-amino-acid deacylase family protein [Bryobacteraceae bacterium]